jgi:hypothetical protein
MEANSLVEEKYNKFCETKVGKKDEFCKERAKEINLDKKKR